MFNGLARNPLPSNPGYKVAELGETLQSAARPRRVTIGDAGPRLAEKRCIRKKNTGNKKNNNKKATKEKPGVKKTLKSKPKKKILSTKKYRPDIFE